jgi:hypothetical protein
MKVGLLTLAQKKEIAGKQFAPDCYFNPILDNNLNWVISIEEIEQATVPPYDWVKDLPLIDFEPKQTEI